MDLIKGDKGPHVMQLQAALRAAGFPLARYGVDGIFGMETEATVRQAQQQFGLPASGIADRLLLSRLGITQKNAHSVTASQGKPAGIGGVWLLAGLAVIAAGIAIKKNYRN